jgi:sulfite reductase alpha subunit-like flavoprotein
MNGLLLKDSKLKEFLAKNYNIVDFLTLFDSINIPFLEFYTIMPKISVTCILIKPRYYTVASSQNYNKEKLEIAISLVDFESNGKQRLGLTSKYFKNLFDKNMFVAGTIANKITVRESSFRVPHDNRPVIYYFKISF